MSEQILNKILGELQVIRDGQISMGKEIQEIKAEQQQMKIEQQQMKIEQQQMKQAILETNDTVKEIAEAQRNFEKRTTQELKTHAYSIDVLNREQLLIKSDIEFLKTELKKA